jgi:glyoxylase-like metal-dependent hydrolase (beta-lactamase superfamily II)
MHGRWDRTGCLAELKEYTGTPLAIHVADPSSIETPMAVMTLGGPPWGWLLSALLSAVVIARLKLPAATVDVIVLGDGMSLEPCGARGRVLHIPGHTPGSSASFGTRAPRSSATRR